MATLLPNTEVDRHALKGYRVFLFSHDHPHPAHVHVGKGRRFSDWELESLSCLDEDGLSPSEIRQQRILLEKYADVIWRTWNDYWVRAKVSGRTAGGGGA